MANYKEILRLKNLGLSNNEVAAAVKCGRNKSKDSSAPSNGNSRRALTAVQKCDSFVELLEYDNSGRRNFKYNIL